MSCIMIQLLQLKPTKCTLVIISFTKALLHVSGHWRSIIFVEYKHYGLILCPKVHGIVVNHHCVLYRVIKKSLCTWWLQYNHQVHRDLFITLYVGWSRYATVEGVLWLRAWARYGILELVATSSGWMASQPMLRGSSLSSSWWGQKWSLKHWLTCSPCTWPSY
jgi:hypothetical protein